MSNRTLVPIKTLKKDSPEMTKRQRTIQIRIEIGGMVEKATVLSKIEAYLIDDVEGSVIMDHSEIARILRENSALLRSMECSLNEIWNHAKHILKKFYEFEKGRIVSGIQITDQSDVVDLVVPNFVDVIDDDESLDITSVG